MKTALKPYPVYHDSGSPWIGKVPAHWEVRQLGQLGKLSKGKGGSKEDEVSKGIPCVRYGDLYTTHSFFIEKTRAYVSRESSKNYTPIIFGDVLFAASGETIEDIGKSAVNLINTSACCGGDVILFRPHSEIVARYMGYAMDCRSSTEQKVVMGRGITVMHIYGNQLKRLLIPYPPPAEQTAIARFLDHVGKHVEFYVDAKERLITLLKEKRQTVINRAVTRGLSPNTTFRATGIDWMPEVPVHWEVRQLGQLGKLSKGRGGSKEDEVSEGIPCVRYGDLYTTHSFFIDKTRTFVSKEASKNYTPIFFGDVLFAASGETIEDIGKSSVNLIETNACCGGDVIIFRPHNETVARYMGYAMDCRASTAQKAAMGRGITVMHIYGNQLKRLLLPLPPLAEQTAISDYLDNSVSDIQIAINYAQSQIKLVHEYYERLTNDVVTGKLDVRNVQVNFAMENENQNSKLNQLFADFDARGVGLNMADNLPREALYRRNASS